MEVRFFVDADLLGVARILASVRADVTYPGDPGGIAADGFQRAPCAIKPGEKDADWIPQVAKNGWVVISRDRHIQHRPSERQAIVDAKARMFRLDSRHALNKWGQLEMICRNGGSLMTWQTFRDPGFTRRLAHPPRRCCDP